jgi:succinate dehydrogenase hydrophobic anchor subunit
MEEAVAQLEEEKDKLVEENMVRFILMRFSKVMLIFHCFFCFFFAKQKLSGSVTRLRGELSQQQQLQQQTQLPANVELNAAA